MQTHVGMPIDAVYFERWLALFRQAAVDVCPKPAAAFFIARAEMIAESLQLGIACAKSREGDAPPQAGVSLPIGRPAASS
jgi:hemoglobin